MTETAVLTLCFVLTFGFIGYKIRKFLKNALSAYIEKIRNNINDSELLKLQAINMLEKIKEKEKSINYEINKNNIETEKKISVIKDNFDEKLETMSAKIIDDSKKRIKYEKEAILEQLKKQIEDLIKTVVNEYIETHMNDDEKEAVFLKTISKIDFKRLIKAKN